MTAKGQRSRAFTAKQRCSQCCHLNSACPNRLVHLCAVRIQTFAFEGPRQVSSAHTLAPSRPKRTAIDHAGEITMASMLPAKRIYRHCYRCERALVLTVKHSRTRRATLSPAGLPHAPVLLASLCSGVTLEPQVSLPALPHYVAA